MSENLPMGGFTPEELKEQLKSVAHEYSIGDWALEYIAQLEAALDKRLRSEYVDEDHRLGGIGITFEEFRKKALGGDDDPGSVA